MSAPVVPQRPARSSQNGSSISSPIANMPQIPPRPARTIEKSISPSREFATRSPLNDPLFKSPGSNGPLPPTSRLQQRPSIASLPLIGQEGEEYTSLDQVPQVAKEKETPGTPADTRDAEHLPLLAPKPSVPIAAAREQVAPIVQTGSGLSVEDDDHEFGLRKTVSRSREFRPSSSGLSREIINEVSRRSSLHEDNQEHGIPHFGSFVPMYPNAGDVQAPSSSPYQAYGTSGHGNDGSRPSTTDGRRRSLASFHGPPGSYGLHGHGLVHQDQFEKAWYQKHPEELIKEEQGSHGPTSALSRAEWALSSDELNKLVRENNERGFGTSESVIGVPTEAIGYRASEEYSSRTQSPALQPVKPRTLSQTQAESPLHRAGTGGDAAIVVDKLHVDAPPVQGDKYTGAGYDPPTEDLGPLGGNTAEMGGLILEQGSGTPILASDEVSKRPGSGYLHPAVSAEAAKHADGEYFSDYDSDTLPAWQRRKGSNSGRNSRRTSRPSSARFHHHDMETTGTPLNEIEEYEPLFNDEDEKTQRPLSIANKLLQRPGMDKRRFPSQDIWEDTPNSLQLQTTVGGPQEPEETSMAATKSSAVFELPEKELARKGEILEDERLSFLQDSTRGFAKPKFNPHISEEVHGRPGLRHRFPSQDIWEDTPNSLRLETTVGPEQGTITSPVGQKLPPVNDLAQGFMAADRSLGAPEVTPTIPARPLRAKAADVSTTAKEGAPNDKKAPSVPDRPKPQVPARPTRSSQDEDSTLSKPLSGGSTGSTELSTSAEQSITASKAKPPVPTRPAQSSKFASIKAGFMNDLNSRLQLGPKAPKPAAEPTAEVEEEKAPLADARKGRARGPARRKPVETETSSASAESSTTAWGFSMPRTLWHVGHSDLSVASTKAPSAPVRTVNDINEAPTASPLATNTAGETLQSTSEAPLVMSGDLAHKSDAAMDDRAEKEELQEKENLREFEKHRIGNEGDMPEPIPEPETSPGKAAESAQSSLVDEAVQTGETKMSSSLVGEEGRSEDVTAFVDGGRDAGETVIVKSEETTL